MTAIRTRADALREYLTGAGSDGGSQPSSSACTGGFRSSTGALSYGITLVNPLLNLSVDFASGGNVEGDGTLVCIDNGNVAWNDSGETQGPIVTLPNNGSQAVLEAANNPGAFLRVTRTSASGIASDPSGNPCTVRLKTLLDNVFGWDDVPSALAASGGSQYRATLLKNEHANASSILNLKRWIGTLGTGTVSGAGGLPASGAGTINASSTLADWPSSGWCHIRQSNGTTREIVYYSSRTNFTLTVPAAGRQLLGTSQSAGAFSDFIDAVPGIALAIDTNGVQAGGSSFLSIANTTTAPAGVTWNRGINIATGLNIGTLTAGQQVAIWMWRHLPAGMNALPLAKSKVVTSFDAP